MAQKRASGKTSTINRATPALLERYCRGLETWPRSWMAWEKDLAPGEGLVNCFRPFLAELVGSELAPKTIQKHVDNLWALGGEIIRKLTEDPALRKKPIERILDDSIDEEGGLLVYALESEEPQQRSLDSTCKKLFHFRNRSGR
jgi:hypothetical protein